MKIKTLIEYILAIVSMICNLFSFVVCILKCCAVIDWPWICITAPWVAAALLLVAVNCLHIWRYKR